eukprot:364943-Chlamydomonas_euryale.AAC.37
MVWAFGVGVGCRTCLTLQPMPTLPADFVGNDEETAQECMDCVAAPTVFDAWGCTNCYKSAYDTRNDAYPVNASDCVACVEASPYEDKVGSYNWACAQCAGIEDASVRELCQTCILTPAAESADLASDLLDHSWVGNASEIICSCVDMATASTWGENAPGELSSWYTSECPNCTAMQKTCYKRRK